MMNWLISVADDIIGLFYPRICGGCDSHLLKHESNLCLICLHKLPKTYFWDYDVNPVEKLFWGRLEICSACTFLHFEKENVVQHLMHRFKYEGKSGIGTELGKAFAYILKDKHWFSDIDIIVPVPLHFSKEQRRGYNQSLYIAKGMAEVYEVKVWPSIITRVIASDSQTRKSRYQRVENVDDVFRIDNPSRLKGKTVLLVDDVITTGATLEAAGNQLLRAGVARLYVATLAIA